MPSTASMAATRLKSMQLMLRHLSFCERSSARSNRGKTLALRLCRMILRIPTIDDVRAAERVIREHLSPAPLIRSYELERELGLPSSRRIWLKDYGWTPSGSFKLYGGLNWMA